MGTETRQRDRQIKIRLNETEYSRIVALSKQHDLAPSTFLRELGLMHQPRSTIDAQAVERITKLHGDLGRTAGLLKLWLTTPESPPPFAGNRQRSHHGIAGIEGGDRRNAKAIMNR